MTQVNLTDSSAVARDPVRALRERFGRASKRRACGGESGDVQFYVHKDCTPEVVLYETPCSAEMIECAMFRRPEYGRGQARLRTLLRSRPAAKASGDTKYNWCVDVLTQVSRTLDATNIPSVFLAEAARDTQLTPQETAAVTAEIEGNPGLGRGGQLFPRARAFIRNQQRLRDRNAHADRTVVLAPLVPTFGGDFRSTARSMRPRNGAVAPYALTGAWFFGLGEVTSVGPAGYEEDPAFWTPHTMEQGLNASGAGVDAQAWFRAHPGPGVARLDPPPACTTNNYDGSTYCTPGTSCAGYGCPNVMGGSMTVELCSRYALDVINTPMDTFIGMGIAAWVKHLGPFIRNGQIEVPAEMQDEIDALRWRALWAAMTGKVVQWISMATGLLAAIGVSLSVPVAGYVAAALLVVGIVFSFIFGASHSCPKLPLKRVITGEADCAPIMDPDGKLRIQGIGTPGVEDWLNRVLPTLGEKSGMSVLGAFQTEAPETAQLLDMNAFLTDTPPAEPESKVGPLVVGGIAVVGGLLVLKALVR